MENQLESWTTPKWKIRLHTSAKDLLAVTIGPLEKHELSSNIILPHAIDLETTERGRYPLLSRVPAEYTAPASEPEPPAEHGMASKRIPFFWLTVWAVGSAAEMSTTLQLVLSCLEWPLGTYPIFLWSPIEKEAPGIGSLFERFHPLCKALTTLVDVRRVFSVFGRTDLVHAFSAAWASLTRVSIERQPYYVAHLSYCTGGTLKSSDLEMNEGHSIRLATASDLDAVSTLCKEFADESVSTRRP